MCAQHEALQMVGIAGPICSYTRDYPNTLYLLTSTVPETIMAALRPTLLTEACVDGLRGERLAWLWHDGGSGCHCATRRGLRPDGRSRRSEAIF